MFGNSDSKKAKRLSKLARKTISLMEAFVGTPGLSSGDRLTIQEFLERRRDDLEGYEQVARGEISDADRMLGLSPTRNYGLAEQAMTNELRRFSSSPGVFVQYIRAVKAF